MLLKNSGRKGPYLLKTDKGLFVPAENVADGRAREVLPHLFWIGEIASARNVAGYKPNSFLQNSCTRESILGGDVLVEEHDAFRYTYDNWHSDRKAGASVDEYIQRSLL